MSEYLRVVGGFLPIFAVFHWSVEALGSDRGQAGLVVCLLVVSQNAKPRASLPFWRLCRRKHLPPQRSDARQRTHAAYQPNIQTAWETLRLLALGIEPKAGRQGAEWNREQLQRIDLRWHDLRHEGACRLLADGVDIRIIQLMLGHASNQQTQRYLNVTDEELRRGLEVSWNNKTRPLRLASGT